MFGLSRFQLTLQFGAPTPKAEYLVAQTHHTEQFYGELNQAMKNKPKVEHRSLIDIQAILMLMEQQTKAAQFSKSHEVTPTNEWLD